MSLIITYMGDDGILKIVHPAPKAVAEAGKPEEEFLKDLAKRLELVEFDIIDAKELPEDRSFRDAWKQKNKKVKVDMPKAVDIQMDKLRHKRNKKLAELDVEYMRALEEDPKKAEEVAKRKRELREMPKKIEKEMKALKKPEDLKRFKPKMLED